MTLTYPGCTLAKREEARRLHLAAYRDWIDAGAKPAARYGRIEE